MVYRTGDGNGEKYRPKLPDCCIRFAYRNPHRTIIWSKKISSRSTKNRRHCIIIGKICVMEMVYCVLGLLAGQRIVGTWGHGDRKKFGKHRLKVGYPV